MGCSSSVGVVSSTDALASINSPWTLTGETQTEYNMSNKIKTFNVEPPNVGVQLVGVVSTVAFSTHIPMIGRESAAAMSAERCRAVALAKAKAEARLMGANSLFAVRFTLSTLNADWCASCTATACIIPRPGSGGVRSVSAAEEKKLLGDAVETESVVLYDGEDDDDNNSASVYPNVATPLFSGPSPPAYYNTGGL